MTLALIAAIIDNHDCCSPFGVRLLDSTRRGFEASRLRDSNSDQMAIQFKLSNHRLLATRQDSSSCFGEFRRLFGALSALRVHFRRSKWPKKLRKLARSLLRSLWALIELDQSAPKGCCCRSGSSGRSGHFRSSRTRGTRPKRARARPMARNAAQAGSQLAPTFVAGANCSPLPSIGVSIEDQLKRSQFELRAASCELHFALAASNAWPDFGWISVSNSNSNSNSCILLESNFAPSSKFEFEFEIRIHIRLILIMSSIGCLLFRASAKSRNSSTG